MAESLSYCFTFVCQEGRLEPESMLLAASLSRFLRCEHELVACVPEPAERWGTPGEVTLSLFEDLGVRVVGIRNEIDEDYPHGNKISCLGIETTADKVVFLDSDMLCMREFPDDPRFRTDVNVKPADHVTFGKHPEIWKRVYETAGVPFPDARIRTTVDRKESVPYYNAGVVGVRRGAGLPDVWRECCVTIDADPEIEPKRPWLDQIALPVAIAKLGLETDLLDESYNFPANLRKKLPAEPPLLCHHHGPEVLAKHPAARRLAAELAAEHPALWETLRRDESWAWVLGADRQTGRRKLPGLGVVRRGAERWHRARTSSDEHRRNVIVTGFPRSGTSLYSTLLNSIDNVVCLNEVSPTPNAFGFFRRMRGRIAAGKPVPNKFSASGKLATNTIDPKTRLAEQRFTVKNDRFVLAQKFTLPYLNRLETLVDQGWNVWLLVRHPLFAITSWKRVPQNFAIAKVDPPDPLLAHIPVESGDADGKRIEIWNHYARRIDALRDRVHIVRYEDLVADVASELGRFCAPFGLTLPEEIEPLRSANDPSRYGDLDPAFRAAVNEGCELDRFGYEPA